RTMRKVPEGWARVCPAVFYEDASKAIDWLCRAFGFEVQLKDGGKGGRMEHSERRIGQGLAMASQAGGRSERTGPLPTRSPRADGGLNDERLAICVDDADAHCARARAAGGKVHEEPTTTDYGDDYWSDRTYRVEDPEGHHWWFIQRVRDAKPRAR